MPVKRRVRSSTSSNELEVKGEPRDARVPAVGNNAKAMRGLHEEKGVRFGIFRLGSPPKWEEDDEESNVRFLERCYGCKKVLETDVTVYMYGYLHAFCAKECRQRQININDKAAAVSKKYNGRST